MGNISTMFNRMVRRWLNGFSFSPFAPIHKMRQGMDWSKVIPVSTEPFEFGPIQTKWLEALESGEYKQGKRELKSLVSFQGDVGKPVHHAYCCLGVICELQGLAWQDFGPLTGAGFCYMGSHAYNNYLPEDFAYSIGLRGPSGPFTNPVNANNCAYSNLAEMNDDVESRLSFKDIAAYIRHDPHNIFHHSA